MVELIIEHWTQRDGRSDFLWSVWRQGQRLEMGRPLPSAEAAEREGRAWCARALAQEPDRVTRL